MQYKVPKILQWDIYKHIYSTFLPGFYFVYWISRPEVYKWRPKITRDTVSTLRNVHSKTESILQIPDNQQWIPITFRNFSWRCELAIGFKMVIKIYMYVQHVNMHFLNICNIINDTYKSILFYLLVADLIPDRFLKHLITFHSVSRQLESVNRIYSKYILFLFIVAHVNCCCLWRERCRTIQGRYSRHFSWWIGGFYHIYQQTKRQLPY